MFALVLPTCHWHVGFEWVRIHESSPTSKRPTSFAGGAVRGRWIRLPVCEANRKETTSLRTGCAICHWHIAFEWVRIHLLFSNKKTPVILVFFCWWGKVDSNHRSYKQQIYSLSPLATREFPHMKFASRTGLGYHIIFWKNVKKKIQKYEKNLRAWPGGLSDCQKSLAEFAASAAKRIRIIFCRGVYLAENTTQAASAVRRAANLMEQLPVAIAP